MLGERRESFMNAIDRNFLINHGFTEDINRNRLLELFRNNNKFKEINISVSITNPTMLLARSKEKNVTVAINSIQGDRIILKKNKTVIMNILLDEIEGCLYKVYENGLYEFEFEVRDFRYSLHISI